MLRSSDSLDKSIEKSLEALSQTSLTVMPSTRNLLPFLDRFHQHETPVLKVYREVAASHRLAVEDLLSLIRPRRVYLPPLLSILLSRCKGVPDIPRQLIRLRSEFSDFRTTMADWFAELDNATSLRDKLEVSRELSSANAALVDRIEGKRQGVYKEVAGAFVDAAEDGSPTKLVTKPIFALVRQGVTTVAPDVFALRRYTGMIDLIDKSLEIKDYTSLLARVFGDSLCISQSEITAARRYREFVEKKYGIPLVGPS
ncbi:MAG: hypothetical protein AAF266_03040 [Planctomycetota bacterium]